MLLFDEKHTKAMNKVQTKHDHRLRLAFATKKQIEMGCTLLAGN